MQITDFLSDYYAIVESAYKSTCYDEYVLLIKYYLDGHTFAAGVAIQRVKSQNSIL